MESDPLYVRETEEIIGFPPWLTDGQADASAAMAQRYLARGSEKTTSTADHYQVVVHVDESALRDEGGKSEYPIESVRRISCDSSIITVIEDENGEPLNVGRKRRVVSPQLKRALLSRDKCCRSPLVLVKNGLPPIT